MSLQSRLLELITAVGADIKALQQATKDLYNASTTNQTGFAANTYLAGSVINIPTGKIQVGTKYRCKFNVVKTAAGVVAPIVTPKIGTAGTTADASVATMTFAAQTAVIDEGHFEVELVFRVAGAAAIVQAMGALYHRLAATGLSTSGVSDVIQTSGAVDVTPAGLKIGLSVNGGTSAAWTVSVVSAELVNLAP